jgi:VanZ family protein
VPKLLPDHSCSIHCAAAGTGELTLIRIFQIFCVLGFLCALALFAVLALAPPGTDLGVFANSPDDKYGHFGAFFLLGPLAVAAFPRLPLGWTVLALLVIGAGLELGQTLTGREASLEDLAANVLGVLAGMFPLGAYRLRLALIRRAEERKVKQVANDI